MDSIEKQLEDTVKFIEEYTKSSGLDFAKEVKAPECLYFTVEQIKKLDTEQLTEYSYMVNLYSLHVQSVINKNRALERWLKTKIDDFAAEYLPEVDPRHGFNERVLIARTKPEICKRLNDILRTTSAKLDILHDIPNHIKIMADCIKEFKFLAFKKEKEYGT